MLRAAVLSGGGVKGAFQVGALQSAMFDHKLFCNKWFGTSTGALQSCIMCQGVDLAGQQVYADALAHIYRSIKGNKDIFDGPSNDLTKGIALLNMQFGKRQSLYEPNGLKRLIDAYFNPEVSFSNDVLAVGVVDFNRRTSHVIEGLGEQYIKDFILASASMPVYFPPVNIYGANYIDGGVRDQTLLQPAVEWLIQQDPDDTQPKELLVILTQPLTPKPVLSKTDKLLDKLSTTLDIMVNEVFMNDLKAITKKNAASSNGDPRYRHITIRLIQPPTYYNATLEFDPKLINRMIEDGLKAPIEIIEYPHSLP